MFDALVDEVTRRIEATTLPHQHTHCMSIEDDTPHTTLNESQVRPHQE